MGQLLSVGRRASVRRNTVTSALPKGTSSVGTQYEGDTKMAIENCLGDVSAQDDPLLFKAFYDVPAYADAAKGFFSLVLGRKGSGKSAIRRKLEKDAQERNELTETITPTTFKYSELAAVEDETRAYPGFPFDEMVRAVWSHIVLTTGMRILLHSRQARMVDKHLLDRMKAYLRIHGLAGKKDRPQFLRTCRQILDSLKGKSSVYTDLVIGPAEAIAEAINGRYLESAKEAFKAALDGYGIKLNLFIDELDQEWGGGRVAVIRFLNGIVDFLYHITLVPEYKADYPRNLNVKVFLRDEAYDAIHYPNARKMRARSVRIAWNRGSLFQMISSRVGIASGHAARKPDFMWQRLFPTTLTRVPKRHVFDYLLDYTFWRPRDVIMLLQKAITIAGHQGRVVEKGQHVEGKVGEADLLEAKEEFAADFVKDELSEAQVLFPKCEDITNCFSSLPWAMKPNDVFTILAGAARDLELCEDPRAIAQELYGLGFLGAVLPKPIQPRHTKRKAYDRVFWYHRRSVNLERADHLVVHRAFHVPASLGVAEDPLDEWTDV